MNPAYIPLTKLMASKRRELNRLCDLVRNNPHSSAEAIALAEALEFHKQDKEAA